MRLMIGNVFYTVSNYGNIVLFLKSIGMSICLRNIELFFIYRKFIGNVLKFIFFIG